MYIALLLLGVLFVAVAIPQVDGFSRWMDLVGGAAGLVLIVISMKELMS